MNSGAGMGQKPDDWRTVPLCAGPNASINETLGCHDRQHTVGEPAFWRGYETRKGQSVEQLIAEFINASAKRAEIMAIKRERENG